MAKSFNLTPKRIEALRFLRSRPSGVYVRMLAQEVLVGEYRRRIKSGFSAQQAKRPGAGCAVPLIQSPAAQTRSLQVRDSGGLRFSGFQCIGARC